MALVAGRMRVPSPATGKTALRTRCFIRLLIGVAGISGYEPADDLITHKPIKRFPDSATRSSRGKSYGWLMFQQHVARAVDLGCEIVGAAMVGVQLHHQPVMRGAD